MYLFLLFIYFLRHKRGINVAEKLSLLCNSNRYHLVLFLPNWKFFDIALLIVFRTYLDGPKFNAALSLSLLTRLFFYPQIMLTA